MKLNNIIIFLSLFIISCRKDASDVSLPEFKQKIVVEAYLSPDLDSNFIYISSTQPRFGELTGEAPSLGNLNVFLSDGTNMIKLDTTHKDRYHYYSYVYKIRNMPVNEGRTYHINVSSDLGLKAEADCTVPVKKDFKLEVDTSSVISSDEYGNKRSITYVDFSITDIPGESDFYRLLYIYHEYWSKFVYPKKSLEKLLLGEVPVTIVQQPDAGDRVFNDFGRDGKKFILRSVELSPVYLHDYDPIYDDPRFHYGPDSVIMYVYLLNTDKPYYDFHHSLENFSLGDSPFTEPSFFYSNIKGGAGIFASYTIDSLRFRLK